MNTYENMSDSELIRLREELTNRIAYKDVDQMSKKILMNSLYGATGSPYFRFYDLRIAESITLSGQLAIRWIADRLNEYFQKHCDDPTYDFCFYSDTDSVYITLKKFVEKYLPNVHDVQEMTDKLSEAYEGLIGPYINRSYEKLADYTNSYENRMFMEREVIADQAIWTAKKRYVMNVIDSEGVRGTKLKVMGLEAVRSSTPEFVRVALKKGYQIALTGSQEDLLDYIDEFRKEFDSHSISDVAKASTCNNMAKYTDPVTLFVKGTPKHVKGALIHNHLVMEKGLEATIPLIRDGEKVKFISLIERNPTPDKVIAFQGHLPPELGMDKYVDREIMFTKLFYDPLKNMIECVGWTTARPTGLSAFL